MRDSRKYAWLLVVVLCLFTALFALPAPAPAEDIHAEGEYKLFPNGDLAVTFKLAPSMIIYQKVRESVSNLYLVLRGFASSRAAAETVDQKADWDDSAHTMNFSMKFLGAARNLGNHWEIDVPKGTDFINLDEAKRTFYFNETAEAGEMATVRGTSKLIMPVQAQQMKYDSSRRIVYYVMPPVNNPSGRNMALLIAGAVLMVLGAGMAAGSLFLKA